MPPVRWQSRARLAIAAFGIVCAVAVYLALGERQRSRPSPGVERIDPAAMLEMGPGELRQTETHGTKEVGRVRFATHVTYPDGSSRLTGVEIETESNGRTYVVTAGEAWSAHDGLVYELKNVVHVRASDGFELTTASGSYLRKTGLVQTSEPVSFRKGRMAGSGRGMTYDQQTDTLRIAEAARVTISSGDLGDTEVSAGAAVLDRAQHVLTLDGAVHVREGAQTMSADRAVARLSADDQQITFVELRGSAAIDGGAAAERMRSRDMDLDYADDRRVLEHVLLAGDAEAIVRDGTQTREFSGGTLEVSFGPEGALARLVGHTNVRVVLPAAEGVPARTVEAATLEAEGGEGAVLERMRFESSVVFRESARDSSRVARAAALTVTLEPDGSVGAAVFTGGARFEDGDLSARAAEARYEPGGGTLRLSGVDARGEPRVEDESVTIDASDVTVGLDSRRVDASGRVKTTLVPAGDTAGSRRSGSRRSPTRLPGLLAEEEAARVTADRLLYDSSMGTASYSGTARLWQKETEVRADSMDIDLRRGDLTARGGAEAVLVFDNGRMRGSADEFTYSDALRRVTYLSGDGDAQAPSQARITGPSGDVRGGRIDVVLEAGGGAVQRLEAARNVEAVVDDRRALGDRLTYHAAEERYVVTGGVSRPASVRFAATCQEIVGGTLIFSRTADTMQVDGGEVLRTRTQREECR